MLRERKGRGRVRGERRPDAKDRTGRQGHEDTRTRGHEDTRMRGRERPPIFCSTAPGCALVHQLALAHLRLPCVLQLRELLCEGPAQVLLQTRVEHMRDGLVGLRAENVPGLPHTCASDHATDMSYIRTRINTWRGVCGVDGPLCTWCCGRR